MRVLTRKRKLSKAMDEIASITLWGFNLMFLLLIIWILYTILSKGLPKLTPNFLVELPDEINIGGGIGPVLFNSFYVLFISLIISIPVGVGAGIYLSEYAQKNKFTFLLRMSVESLASVPSVVFGLFGMAIFVEYFHIGLTIIGAAVTLALLNLPVITRVTEESIRALPIGLREASYALGTTKFECIRTIVLPAAFNGIVTGICLVAGRAYGESAVIILTAGTSTSGRMWDFNLFSPGGTLAVHLWYIQSEAIVPDAKEIADKAAAVLVLVVLMINFLLRIPVWFKEHKFKI